MLPLIGFHMPTAPFEKCIPGLQKFLWAGTDETSQLKSMVAIYLDTRIFTFSIISQPYKEADLGACSIFRVLHSVWWHSIEYYFMACLLCFL
ncbi:hypothetical protein NC652_024169 [Populus alba x Populus x berolinensis]|nr:hypothetical protein NC652_024169 [Populus alba x Populus x berolinensis]